MGNYNRGLAGQPVTILVANGPATQGVNGLFRFFKVLSITPADANVTAQLADSDSLGGLIPIVASDSIGYTRLERKLIEFPWKQMLLFSDTANTVVDFVWSLDDTYINDQTSTTGGGGGTLTVVDAVTGDTADANAQTVYLTNDGGVPDTFGEALNAIGFSTIIQSGPAGIYPDAGFRTWLNNGPLAKAVQLMTQNTDNEASYPIGGDYTSLGIGGSNYAMFCSLYCNDQNSFVANPVPGLAYDAPGIGSGSDAPIVSPGFNTYDTSDTTVGAAINSTNFQVWRIAITASGADPLSFLDPGGIALNIYPAVGGAAITAIPGGADVGTVYYVNTCGVPAITPTSADNWDFRKGEGPFPFKP